VTRRVSDPIELAAVVAIGDPQDLAIGQAGGGREAHRSFAVDSGILQDGGRGCNPPRWIRRGSGGQGAHAFGGAGGGCIQPSGHRVRGA